jgi:glutathione S-transferase
MFTLYYKPTCAFSQRVLQMAENFNVELELKDVSESEEFAAELLEKGGSDKTPFLVDSERNVSMYESSDIIDHLREFGRNASTVSVVSKPRVHVGGSTCVSCEG